MAHFLFSFMRMVSCEFFLKCDYVLNSSSIWLNFKLCYVATQLFQFANNYTINASPRGKRKIIDCVVLYIKWLTWFILLHKDYTTWAIFAVWWGELCSSTEKLHWKSENVFYSSKSDLIIGRLSMKWMSTGPSVK